MQIQHKRLKLALVLANMTQNELCDQIGLFRQYLWAMCSGVRPANPKWLKKIAKTLKVPGGWLCGKERDMYELVTDEKLIEFGIYNYQILGG